MSRSSRDTAELSSLSCAGAACFAVRAAPGATGWMPTVFSAGRAEAPSMPLASPTPRPTGTNTSTLTAGSGPVSVQGAPAQPVRGVLGTKVTFSRLRLSPRRQGVYVARRHGTCHGQLKLVRRTRTRKHGRWLTSSVLLARATYDLRAGEQGVDHARADALRACLARPNEVGKSRSCASRDRRWVSGGPKAGATGVAPSMYPPARRATDRGLARAAGSTR